MEPQCFEFDSERWWNYSFLTLTYISVEFIDFFEWITDDRSIGLIDRYCYPQWQLHMERITPLRKSIQHFQLSSSSTGGPHPRWVLFISPMLLVADLADTSLKHRWKPGTLVLTLEYSVRAIQWMSIWQDLEVFQVSLHPCDLDERVLKAGCVLMKWQTSLHTCLLYL